MVVETYLQGLIEDLKRNKKAVTAELSITADYSRAQACLCSALRDYRKSKNMRVPAVSFDGDEVYIDDFASLDEHVKIVRGFIRTLVAGGSALQLQKENHSGWSRIIKRLPVHVITTRWLKQAIDRYRLDNGKTILSGSVLFGLTTSYAQPVPSQYHTSDDKLVVLAYFYLRNLHGEPFAQQIISTWEGLEGKADFLAALEAGYMTYEKILEKVIDIVIDELAIVVV